jgi:hypothetical protein
MSHKNIKYNFSSYTPPAPPPPPTCMIHSNNPLLAELNPLNFFETTIEDN